MLLPSLYLFIFMLFLTPITTATDATEWDYGDAPRFSVGKYRVVGCNYGKFEGGIWVTLVPLKRWAKIQVASINTASGLAALNLFFNHADPEIVRSIFLKIANGTSMPVADEKEPQPPTIICANPDIPSLSKFSALCDDSSRWTARIPNTMFLVLCPQLFGLKHLPRKNDCVAKLPNGKYHSGQGLARTILTVIFHELVHLYLDAAVLKPEVLHLWKIFDLSPEKAVRNPANYVFYLASMVVNCTIFTPPHSALPGGN